MEKKNNKLNKVYEKYLSKVSSLVEKDPSAQEFFHLLETASQTEITSIARQEIKLFDEKWIDNIAVGIDAIDHIIKDPKKFIKTVGVLTPVELARKTNAESIMHLSSHSQYVKSIDEEGNIIPDKVLNIEAEDDYEIYENRFVKTLINKLLIFIEMRYSYITKHCNTRDTDILVTKSSLVIGDTTFEIEQKVKISTPSADEGNREYNQTLLNKITDLRSKVRFFLESDFMYQLRNAKPVYAPIQQTNIIRKNKNYKQCYELFKFLDSYDKLGLSVHVKEAKGEITPDYLKRLYMQIMYTELSLETSKRDLVKIDEVKPRKIKPRINQMHINDRDLNDKKFDMITGIGPSKAQLDREKARKKAQLAREKALAKKKAALEAKKKREAEKKAKELEKARKAKELEAERLRKEKEKQKLKLAQQKEREKARRLEQKRIEEEREKVRKARLAVAAAAKKAKLQKAAREKAKLEKRKQREAIKAALKKEKMKKLAEEKKAKEKENKKPKVKKVVKAKTEQPIEAENKESVEQ